MQLNALVLCAAMAVAVPVFAQEKAAQEKAAQERAIDTRRSTITIHVGKSGLLSAAAHDLSLIHI